MAFEQKLFWKNLPSKICKPKKINSHIYNLLRYSFLNGIDSCFFLYTGTNNITFDHLNKDPKLLKKLSKRDKQIFLYEPVSYYVSGNDFNLGYYSEFDSTYNSNSKLRAEELDCINDFGKKINGITLNHCDYGLENLLGHKYPFIKFKCRDVFIRQAAMSYMPLDRKIIPTIKKKFWCGNGRYTIHRHMIMCYLADKPGNYSWWYNSNINWDLPFGWVKKEKIDLEYLEKNNTILNTEKFELDFEADKIDIKENNGFYITEGPFSQPNKEYKETFDECFVCIINETRFAQPTANFSEKVIDAINYRKPFIVVAPPKTLEYLKKFGFRTFGEYWSENYDIIQNHNDRMLEIFQLLDYINSKTLKELNIMYNDMLDILDHNRKILKDLPHNPNIIND